MIVRRQRTKVKRFTLYTTYCIMGALKRETQPIKVLKGEKA